MTEKTNDTVWKVDAKACSAGGVVGGAYLDKIGKTDLAALTKAEWDTFLMKVVGGAFLAAIGDIHGDEIPF